MCISKTRVEVICFMGELMATGSITDEDIIILHRSGIRVCGNPCIIRMLSFVMLQLLTTASHRMPTHKSTLAHIHPWMPTRLPMLGSHELTAGQPS